MAFIEIFILPSSMCSRVEIFSVDVQMVHLQCSFVQEETDYDEAILPLQRNCFLRGCPTYAEVKFHVTKMYVYIE
jgi:hypothetical protein